MYKCKNIKNKSIDINLHFYIITNVDVLNYNKKLLETSPFNILYIIVLLDCIIGNNILYILNILSLI